MYDALQVKAALSGPVPSISTPFLRNGDIDWNGLADSIEFIVDAGFKTLLLTYGDSLLSTLSDGEVARLTEFVARAARGRAMTVVCGKPWWQGQTLEFARFAREAGADVLIPVAPDWAQSCGEAELADFYGEAGKIMPFMPLTSLLSGRSVPLDVFRLLINRDTPGFVAVKDDVCADYGRRLAALLDGRRGFLSGGLAENHQDVAPYGADGYLCIFAGFAPRVSRAYWAACSSGDAAGAARVIREYEMPFMELTTKLNLNFDAMVHAAQEIFGIGERWRRLPYESATDSQVESLRAFFISHKML